MLGFSGTAGSGVGSTETAYWDNSVKYVLSYGPFHAAGMYTSGGQDTPMVNDGYGADVGVSYLGFSVDGFYTKENGAVSLKGLLPFGDCSLQWPRDHCPLRGRTISGPQCLHRGIRRLALTTFSAPSRTMRLGT